MAKGSRAVHERGCIFGMGAMEGAAIMDCLNLKMTLSSVDFMLRHLQLLGDAIRSNSTRRS